MATVLSQHLINLKSKLNETDQGNDYGMWTTAERYAAINLAARRLYNMDWIFNKATASVTMTSGVGDLPTDFGGAIYGAWRGTRKPDNKLQKIAGKVLDQLDLTVSGTACQYYVEGGSIKFYPLETVTATVLYRIAANTLATPASDSFTNCPTAFDEWIACIAASILYYDRDDTSKGEMYESMADRLMTGKNNIPGLMDTWFDYDSDNIATPIDTDDFVTNDLGIV